MPRAERVRQASQNIGRRVHWTGDMTRGTITDVASGPGGWPVYVVAWDAGAPDWWTREISTSTRLLTIEGDQP